MGKTLTKMLEDNLVLDSECWELEATKDTFKEWLGTVCLPAHLSKGKDGSRIDATESTCQLLISLVDEP